MNKLKALFVGLVFGLTTLGFSASATAAPASQLPQCEGAYPYYSCKDTVVTYGPEGNAGPLYTITWVYNSQGNSRILWSETTFPKK